jgi:integrase
MPAVVLGLFCGLRSEELARLQWGSVDLKRRKITISPEVGKNRRATDWRYPVIPKGGVEFLQLAPQREGPIAPRRFRACITALHSAAKFESWKVTHANSKRHSFGSYACKLHGIDWTIEQMGNSVRMFVKHYQNSAVTKRQVTEYFGLTPDSVKGSVPA